MARRRPFFLEARPAPPPSIGPARAIDCSTRGPRWAPTALPAAAAALAAALAAPAARRPARHLHLPATLLRRPTRSCEAGGSDLSPQPDESGMIPMCKRSVSDWVMCACVCMRERLCRVAANVLTPEAERGGHEAAEQRDNERPAARCAAHSYGGVWDRSSAAEWQRDVSSADACHRNFRSGDSQPCTLHLST